MNTKLKLDMQTDNIYEVRPKRIEAMQWLGTPDSFSRLKEWGCPVHLDQIENRIQINGVWTTYIERTQLTLRAGKSSSKELVGVPTNYWIIKKINNSEEWWMLDDDCFLVLYQKVNDDQQKINTEEATRVYRANEDLLNEALAKTQLELSAALMEIELLRTQLPKDN